MSNAGHNSLEYANPKSREEYRFLAEVLFEGMLGRVPADFFGRLKDIYGPLSREIDERALRGEISEEIGGGVSGEIGGGKGRDVGGDVSEEIIRRVRSVRWQKRNEIPEGGLERMIPPKIFHRARRALLEEFYPGDKGFRQVAQYWAQLGRGS
ncbi:hypothetical protein HYU14_07055 [Candidatus Woesearchaeota archaeon]|nr:hypothetical protein [Candidatus Woesearchaeota archaeon]